MTGANPNAPAQVPLQVRSRPIFAAPKGTAVRPGVRATVRVGLVMYFLMVILEGAFRKWLLPDANQYIYVAKDVVLAVLCAYAITSIGYLPIPRAMRRSNVGYLFMAFAVYCFVEGFNYQLPNTLLGIWGIRTYVLPMSLVYLVPLGMPDPRVNERMFRRYLWIGIPMAFLCFAQYRLPAGHMLNRYANNELGQKVALVINAVRVTGTFSYISGLGVYVAFQAAALLAVLFADGWRLKRNVWIWLNLLLTIAVIPMTGSRAIALYFVLYLMALAVLGPAARQRGASQARFFIGGICVAALCVGLFGDAFDRLAERTRTSGDTRSRFENVVLQPFQFLELAGLFGYGAAATHQAAPALVPGGASYYWLPRVYFEDEPGRVMLEMGGVGFLLYLALKISVCTAVFHYIRTYGYAVPLAIPVSCLLMATSCIVGSVLFSSVGSSFYWGMLGLHVAQADATAPRPVRKN